MILQRDTEAKVWGSGANPGATVKVTIAKSMSANEIIGVAFAAPDGSWNTTVNVPATATSTLTATDGTSSIKLNDVAFGDVILCGGQSNMGFGMCGTTVISGPGKQTPTEALAALPTAKPLRFYNQHGDMNGGAGSTVKGNVCKDPCTTSNNGFMKWRKATKDNSGAYSAVCLLTAQKLQAALGGAVPVGAIESCVGGTPVAEWTPPNGNLYKQHITPLLPYTFMAALWDQGERDAKTTNSTYYSVEFPKMITGWREAFETPNLPFVYVELCHELGAAEPKERDFWQYGQRAALKLPFVGFATTTDVDKSALHPPDKQDIAPRLALEIQRLALGKNVVARGPELKSTAFSQASSQLTITLSNSSLVVRDGVVVPSPAAGCSNQTMSSAVTQIQMATRGGGSSVPAARAVPFVIQGNTLVVDCTPGDEKTPVLINGDASTCFLYSSASGLPAPPLSLACATGP
jgi:sialate O-acetylesterase